MRLLLDTPATTPQFDYDTYAHALADLIINNKPHFAIGIFGGWGSGKTTLMHAIRRHLQLPTILTVDFCAWRYEKEPHLLAPLLAVLQSALEEWGTSNPDLKEQAFSTAAAVGKAIAALVSGVSFTVGVPEACEISFDADKAMQTGRLPRDGDRAFTPSPFNSCFRALKDTFATWAEKGGRRIVVFIDDLDRCLPASALQTLESIKLFFDFEGFIFVVGLDKSVVEAAVNVKFSHYGKFETDVPSTVTRGALYIKKIFQVPFTLPLVSGGHIAPFVDFLSHEENFTEEQLALVPHLKQHLRFLSGDLGINPREVKRYINAFWILRVTRKDLTNPDVTLALLTIDFRSDWDIVRKGVYLYREAFLRELTLMSAGEKHQLDAIDPQFEQLPLRFLEYVSKDGPAHALLSATRVTDYLYASTLATRPGDQWLESSLILLRYLGAVRLRLKEWVKEPGELSFNALQESIGHAANAVNPQSLPSQLARSLQTDLSRLKSELNNGKDARPAGVYDGWDSWFSNTFRNIVQREQMAGI